METEYGSRREDESARLVAELNSARRQQELDYFIQKAHDWLGWYRDYKVESAYLRATIRRQVLTDYGKRPQS